ncbi:hypothetical protein TKK_0003622 [Trichogramma kaykai]
MAASSSGGDLINNRSNGPDDLMEFELSDNTHRKGNNYKDFNKRRGPDTYDSESQLKKFNAGQQQQQQIQQQHSTVETSYNTGKNELTNSNSNNNTPLVPIVYYRENIPGPYTHKKINNIMAYDNLTFSEAKDAVFPNKSTPPTRSFTDKSVEQYPPLNKESNYSDFNKTNSLENKTTTKIRSTNNQVSNQSPSGKQAMLSHPATSNNNSNNSNKNRTGKSTLATNNTNLASTTRKLYNRLHQEQSNNINGSTRDPLFDVCNPPI